MIDTITYERFILIQPRNRGTRTSESRIKLACIMPSEEEEDEGKCLSRLVQTSETQSVLYRFATSAAKARQRQPVEGRIMLMI